jgi:hypothetical protein
MNRPRTVWWIGAAATALLLFTLLPRPANAIPAFARKYDKDCSGCHTAWPMLNETGQQFKENGYRFLRDEDAGQNKISDSLQFDDVFPVSAVLVGRPYDKKDSGDEKIRALHEAEVMIAGQWSKDFSGFVEFEAEDETGFAIEIPTVALGYHPHEAFNVQVAWSPYLWMDPYDTYSEPRRLTRGHYSVNDVLFGGAGNKLRKPRQIINVAGRAHEKVYYNVGVSGVAGDAEGENPNDIHGRVAIDAAPGAMIGFLAIKGKDAAETRDFTRIGIDGQFDFGDARIMGAFVMGKDDVATTGLAADDDSDVSNNALYVQGLYVVRDGGRPTWVPLVRIDWYEMNDGNDDWTDLTLNLGYYFTENVKGMVEFWTQASRPDDADKDNRITLQVAGAF